MDSLNLGPSVPPASLAVQTHHKLCLDDRVNSMAGTMKKSKLSMYYLLLYPSPTEKYPELRFLQLIGRIKEITLIFVLKTSGLVEFKCMLLQYIQIK